MTNAEIVSALSSPETRDAGLEALYQVTTSALRFMFVTSPRFMVQTGPTDFIHDVFLMVLDQIDRGKIRDVEALRSYIWSTAKYTQNNRNLKERFRNTHSFSQFASEIKGSHGSGNTLGAGAAFSIASCIEDKTAKSPFLETAEKEEQALMRSVLDTLPEPKRGIISRFYLLGQPQEQICSEMGLTPTQFRLHKNRGKEQLRTLCLQRIAPAAARCAA